jgi:predicted aspartyl protease
MKFSSTGRILGSPVKEIGFQLVQANRQDRSNSHSIVCKEIKGKEFLLGTSFLKQIVKNTFQVNNGAASRKMCVK